MQEDSANINGFAHYTPDEQKVYLRITPRCNGLFRMAHDLRIHAMGWIDCIKKVNNLGVVGIAWSPITKTCTGA